MQRQISFSQYRTIDLFIMAVLLAVSQFLIAMAANVWFPQELYVISPVAAIVALVMMRWSGYAAIHAVLGGVLFVFLSKGEWQHLLIYGIGNLAALLALLFFKLFGKERIRLNSVLTVVYGICVQLLMLLGRAAMAAVLGNEPGVCFGFITTDILSCLFTAVVVGIVRRVEGLFEDQKTYLLRIERERQSEGRE